MLENKYNAFYQTLKEGFDKADEQAKEIKRNISDSWFTNNCPSCDEYLRELPLCGNYYSVK